MEEVVVKSSEAASTESLIARRLEHTLWITRQDEAKLKRILELRRLRRRAKQASRNK